MIKENGSFEHRLIYNRKMQRNTNTKTITARKTLGETERPRKPVVILNSPMTIQGCVKGTLAIGQ